jgi:hypothetical protein
MKHAGIRGLGAALCLAAFAALAADPFIRTIRLCGGAPRLATGYVGRSRRVFPPLTTKQEAP